ncbi:MAG: 4Fe-4S dicluster domain-containing protein [Desulfovibrionaceae bacterium]|nr:4Fe-4S dicluster domain-containing protein [Desulfovibrionaceae bacterium]
MVTFSAMWPRRKFLKGALGGLMGGILSTSAQAQTGELQATLIDIDLCDGCEQCVAACHARVASMMPKEIIVPETTGYVRDWSSLEKREIQNRLTPFNWLTIQHIEVEVGDKTLMLHVPRRCMHCLAPTCATFCPTGGITREKSGAVHSVPSVCAGDAMCKRYCPWHIPYLQPGLGTSLLGTLPDKSVMFKCDFCYERLALGLKPLCVEICPKKAMRVGQYQDILKEAEDLAKNKGSQEIFGASDNGGTLTLYVSKVPLREIEIGLLRHKGVRPGLPNLRVPTRDVFTSKLKQSFAIAPLAGIGVACLQLWRDHHMRKPS